MLLQLVLTATLARATVVMDLNPYNYQLETAQKKVLLAFVFEDGMEKNPTLAASWQRLEEDYVWVDYAVLGMVHCHSTGKSICSYLGVTSGPTLAFGKPSKLTFQFPHGFTPDYDNLKRILPLLQPACTLDRRRFCSAAEKEVIRESEAASLEELTSRIEAREAGIKAVVDEYERATREVKDNGQLEIDRHQEEVFQIETTLRLLRECQKNRQSSAPIA